MDASDPLFHALFETAPDAMLVVNREGRIVLANAQLAQLFGYAREDLLGQSVDVLLPESFRARHAADRERFMRTPRVRPMGIGQELAGRRRNGETFPAEVALSPIEVGDGILFAASVRDVSATRRARRALERARYDKYLAQAGQLALQSPLDSTLAQLPEILREALGVDRVLVLASPAGEPTPSALRGSEGLDREALLAALESHERVESVAHGEAFVIAVAGLTGGVYRRALAARLHDVGVAIGWLVALDRGAREFDDEALHFMQTTANLLASVIQRTRAQEQLAHAQRLDAIGQLTGGIAHDVNNLLTVVGGNLQLLEGRIAAGDDPHDAIEAALRAVRSGAELMRKLLAFARRQHLSPQVVDPRRLMEDVGALLRRILGERIELAVVVAPEAPDVLVDPVQLESALINLALNARDAMPRGGTLRIDVRAERIEPRDAGPGRPSGDYLAFAVSDTGVGMSAEVVARAFEPFFTTKERGRGSGLGLSMVYGFARQSGGHVRVSSRLGFGTCIELLLPRAAAGQGDPSPAAIRTPTGDETVMVIEDEDDVRDIAVAFLRSLGYTVLAAAGPTEAMRLLAQRRDVALLFCDVVLGAGASGIELAREARQIRPGLAVLLTTGHEPPQAESEGGIAFPLLLKPYRREELAVAVRERLDAAAAEAADP